MTKLTRALSLAQSINDERRTDSVVNAIIGIENRSTAELRLGDWTFAFDTILGGRGPRIEDQLRATILNGLEKHLEYASSDSKTLPERGEGCAIRLANYYNRKNMRSDACRVLSLFADVQLRAKQFPLPFFIQGLKMGADGRTELKLGENEPQIKGHVRIEVISHVAEDSVYLQHALKSLFLQFNDPILWLLQFLEERSITDSNRRPVLHRGLTAVLDGDDLVAAHLLIPQLEYVLRRLAAGWGASTYKPNRGEGIDLKTLDELLRDPVVELSLGKNVAEYLRVLLTHRGGGNLRNHVCHGVVEPERLDWFTSTVLVHVLLVLATVRETRQPECEDGLDE